MRHKLRLASQCLRVGNQEASFGFRGKDFHVLERFAQAFAAAAGSGLLGFGCFLQHGGKVGVHLIRVVRRANLFNGVADTQQNRFANTLANPFEEINVHVVARFLISFDLRGLSNFPSRVR